MATNGNWSVIFDDKLVIKQSGDGAGTGYVIDDDSFWSQSKFSNIWAIQHGTSNSSDEVEHRDSTPHCAYDSSVLGELSQFTDKWDAAHLSQLQWNWDNDTLADADGNPVEGESESDKITRLGPRPTSYSS